MKSSRAKWLFAKGIRFASTNAKLWVPSLLSLLSLLSWSWRLGDSQGRAVNMRSEKEEREGKRGLALSRWL